MYPITKQTGPIGSDRDMLSKPSVELVMSLLEPCLTLAPHRSLITRLAAALASCSQLSSLGEYKYLTYLTLEQSHCSMLSCYLPQFVILTQLSR